LITPSTTVVNPSAPAGVSFEVPANLSDKDTRKRLSPAALKAYFRVVEKWSLKEQEGTALLGGTSAASYYELKRARNKILDQDKLTRLSLIIGIYKSLNLLFPAPLAQVWIARGNSNPMFAGATPLAYMIAGGIPAMVRVRQLLDARRGGR
jgi:hypothetical protein